MVHDANVYLAQSATFKRLHAARRARGILINQMTGHGHVDLAFAGNLAANALECHGDLRTDWAEDQRLHALYVPTQNLHD